VELERGAGYRLARMFDTFHSNTGHRLRSLRAAAHRALRSLAPRRPTCRAGPQHDHAPLPGPTLPDQHALWVFHSGRPSASSRGRHHWVADTSHSDLVARGVARPPKVNERTAARPGTSCASVRHRRAPVMKFTHTACWCGTCFRRMSMSSPVMRHALTRTPGHSAMPPPFPFGAQSGLSWATTVGNAGCRFK
jgi:hypothetical protein